MTQTITVALTPAIKAVDEAYDILEALRDRDVTVSALDASVSRRRELTSERAQIKAELSYASHLLDMARTLVDHEHQKITRATKDAERKAS